MRQATVWQRSEGDKWHRRNLGKERPPDPVLEAIAFNNLKPKSILEIGCGSGSRLAALHKVYGGKITGLDVSKEALADVPRGIRCLRGTADDLSCITTGSIDMLIYGFVLYQVDRQDLFKIAYEADRVLHDHGVIVIHDFYSERAYSRRYKHDPRLLTYKMDHAQLWLGNPAYRSIYRRIFGESSPMPTSRDDQYAVTILRKDTATAFPLEG